MQKPEFFLVKLFESQEFAQSFLSGKLYSNYLAHFRNLEKDKRGDPHEGVYALSKQGILTLTNQNPDGSIETISLTERDFAEPTLLMPNSVSSLNIFCMHMAHCQEFSIFYCGIRKAGITLNWKYLKRVLGSLVNIWL